MSAGSAAPEAPGLGAWIGLAKLRLNALVVFAVGGGYYLGAAGPLDWLSLAVVVFGAGAAAIGGSALNQLFEREHDALMLRTQGRPLPAGALSATQAAVFGCAASAIGVGVLYGWAGPAPAAVSAFIVLSYLFVYTPLKRRTSLNTVVGAVTGALPPVLGYAAATGGFAAPAWTLFLIVFCWQIPHFLAIAVLHGEDYARGGYRMLPSEDPELRVTARQTVAWCAALLPASLLPVKAGVAGERYGYAAAALGFAFFAQCVWFAVRRDRPRARAVFLGSIAYLTLLWIALLWDKS
jgi:protoheme IX farnesyltransferase